MQKQRPLRGHGNCEPCEICLVTPLSVQTGGGFWEENEKCIADGMLQPSHLRSAAVDRQGCETAGKQIQTVI